MNQSSGKKNRISGKKNLGTTIGIFALTVVIILAASFGAIILMERNAHNAAEKIVTDCVERIDKKISDVESVTQETALAAEGKINSPAELEQLIHDFVKQNESIMGSTIAFEPDAFPEFGRCFAPYSWRTADGEIHDRQLGEETDYYAEEWYVEAKTGGTNYWCEPYFDEGGAKIMMCTFSVPIKAANGRLAAVLTADIGLDDLEGYIDSINPYTDSFIILRSAKGELLVNEGHDFSENKDNVIVKGETPIGWSVELVLPITHLLRGNVSIFAIILVLVLIAVGLVVFVYNILRRTQTNAANEYISKLEALTEQLEEAVSAAQSANRAKTDFLFNMSHDIRTPMNAIIGYTAMAKKHVENPQVQDYLDKIDISGKQLLSLVNQVLEMSMIESGKITIAEEPVNIVEVAKNLETIAAADIGLKGISYTLDTDGIVHQEVFTDVSRINQIIINIIGNAVKYTPEGGRIDCTIKEQPCEKEGYGLYVTSISDTGIGMSEEYLDHVFEEFTREQTSTVSNIQGTGLGMSIVKKLLDLMDSTIDIRSKQGEGTTVTISVPMRWNTGSSESKDEVQKSADVSVEGMRILLVEDNEMNREIAQEILEDEGIEVHTAEDGDKAVDMLKKVAEAGDYFYYNAVLMDIQMPRMNGYEATKAIRAIEVPDGIRLPIIALSANAFEEDKKKSIEAGMDDHLAKPIDVQQLKETLAKYL